jgi:hypothetical protein
MQRQAKKEPGPNGRCKPMEGAVERSEMGRLSVILTVGFSVAENYSDMSRDRHHVKLNEGVTANRLLDFCEAFLKGSPIPGSNPIADGPVLLRLFTAAKERGLVEIEFVPAGRFVPERKVDI